MIKKQILDAISMNSRRSTEDLAAMLNTGTDTIEHEIKEMEENKVIFKFEEVESGYLMSGGFDLTVVIQGKSMKEVSRFVTEKLSTLEYITSTATYFVLKKYKEHGLIMTDEKHDSERMLITP